MDNLESNEHPHGLTIRNNEDKPVVVTVYIERGNDLVFNQTYELAPDAVVTGHLTYETNYTVTVKQGLRTETVVLSNSTFDCNRSGTEITINKWRLDSTTSSTLAYCPEDPLGDD